MRYGQLIAVGIGLSSVAVAHADYAFNDFNNNYGYDNSTGATVSGSTNSVTDVPEYDGMQFTATAGGSLTEIDLAAEVWSGANSMTTSLYTNSSGVLGQELGTWTVTSEMLGAGDEGSIVSYLVSGSNISITAGTTYWLVSTASVSSTFASWSNNELNLNGNYFFNYDNGGDQYHNGELSAFDVLVQPNPEPASIALLGLGALALKRRRSRTAR